MIQDFKFAFRQLWKSPSFTITAVAVLALGIGVNTAIFTLVNAMLFEPPAYRQPAEIVQVFLQDTKDPGSFRSFSYPTFCDIRDQNTVFSGVMAHQDTVVGLGEKGNTRRASADLVSSNYFSVLGVLPASGRSFLPEEEKPGGGGAPPSSATATGRNTPVMRGSLAVPCSSTAAPLPSSASCRKDLPAP